MGSILEEAAGGEAQQKTGQGSTVMSTLQAAGTRRTRCMFLQLVISSADKSYELCAASEYDHETLVIN